VDIATLLKAEALLVKREIAAYVMRIAHCYWSCDLH